MIPKTPLAGIIDRHECPPDNYRPVTGGWCIPLHWCDVEPVPGEFHWDALHDGIAAARDNERLRVRLYAGIWSPRWVMDRAGFYAIPTIGQFCPAWWRISFLDAFELLMHELAEQIETEDTIAEVVFSGPCTEFAEPMIRQRSDREAVVQLRRLGWTRQRDRASMSVCIGIHRDAFQRTLTSLAANPYQDLDLPPGQADVSFTIDVLEEFRTVLGGLAVTGNDSIRWPPQAVDGSDGYATMHAWIREAGPPIAYQTATWEKVGDLLATLDWAVAQGANAVEPPRQYKREVDPLELAPYHVALVENPTNLPGA
jgi:hypothetical protein